MKNLLDEISPIRAISHCLQIISKISFYFAHYQYNTLCQLKQISMEEQDLFGWLQIWAFKKSSGSAQKLKHVCRRCSLKSFITNIQSCKQKGKLGSSQKSPAPDGSSSATMNIFFIQICFRKGRQKILQNCKTLRWGGGRCQLLDHALQRAASAHHCALRLQFTHHPLPR